VKVIDVHAHVIPPALVAMMREGTAPDGVTIEDRDGSPWVVHRQGYRYPLAPAFHDVEARLAKMDEDGVDFAVLSVAPPFLNYGLNPDDARSASAVINDALADMVAQAPDRFAAVATLPMQDPSGAIAELHRAVEVLGLRGVQLGSHVEGTPLDDAGIRPVLEAIQALGVPAILHPYYVGSTPGLDDFYLTNLEGNPWQTALAASRLIFSGTLDALPELDFVLVHGGGHLPYQMGRLDHGHRVRSETAGAANAPSTYLRRFHFDTLTHLPAAAQWLIEQAGADRVMFGTDVPFDMAGGALTSQLEGVDIPSNAFKLIAHENAERLFSLTGDLPRG
jgi:aminocarboxymuconate-semialdehyde decarboxylase